MQLSPRLASVGKAEKGRQKVAQSQAYIFNVHKIEPDVYTGKPMKVWSWTDFVAQLREDPSFIVKLETKGQAYCLRKQACDRGEIRAVVRKVSEKDELGKETIYYLVYREDSEPLVANFDFYWNIYGALPMACKCLIGGNPVTVPDDIVLSRVRTRLSSILRRDYTEAYDAFHEKHGGRASPVEITPLDKGTCRVSIKAEMLERMRMKPVAR